MLRVAPPSGLSLPSAQSSLFSHLFTTLPTIRCRARLHECPHAFPPSDSPTRHPASPTPSSFLPLSRHLHL